MHDGQPILRQPAPLAATGADRLGTIAVGITQPDGSVVTVIWDLPVELVEHELAQLAVRHDQAHREMLSSPEESQLAADFLNSRRDIVRIDHG